MEDTTTQLPIEAARRMTCRFYELSEDDLRLLAEIMERRDVKKGEVFIKEGYRAKEYIYCDHGLVRQFYYKNGRDVSEHFISDGDILICIESLYRQVPTKLMAETLEDSELYYIDYQKYLDLTRKSPGFAEFDRLFQEFDLVETQHKADALRYETARERYERFINDYPKAAREAPLQHIASYLVITPETLSRIRADIAKGK